jgi:hypothetical protein
VLSTPRQGCLICVTSAFLISALTTRRRQVAAEGRGFHQPTHCLCYLPFDGG